MLFYAFHIIYAREALFPYSFFLLVLYDLRIRQLCANGKQEESDVQKEVVVLITLSWLNCIAVIFSKGGCYILGRVLMSRSLMNM